MVYRRRVVLVPNRVGLQGFNRAFSAACAAMLPVDAKNCRARESKTIFLLVGKLYNSDFLGVKVSFYKILL